MLRLDWNLLFNIINLIVLYLLMKKFLIKPVTSIMDQRKALMEQKLADAGNARQEAGELKLQYEEKLKSSYEESAKIMEQARQEARSEYSRIVGEADSQAGKILEDARKTAEAEKARTLRDARSQIAGLAMTAAAKVMGTGAGADGSLALYDQFLAEAGDGNDADRR